MGRPAYREESEVQQVVTKFADCGYELAEFTHARHVTVACWYLCTLPSAEALERMRAALQRFIAHHHRQGYHETITRFWMELLDEYLRGLPEGMTSLERINLAVEAHSEKDVLFRYYTREFVMSEAARSEWVEPDVSSWRSQATDLSEHAGGMSPWNPSFRKPRKWHLRGSACP